MLESEEAHREVLKGLSGLEERVSKKLDMVNLKAVSRNEYVLEEVRYVAAIGEETQDLTKETAKAVESLTTTTVKWFSALDEKVRELISCPPTDDLERKIEELSGQLVSLAQRSTRASSRSCWTGFWRRCLPPQPSSPQPRQCQEPPRSDTPPQPCPGRSPCRTCLIRHPHNPRRRPSPPGARGPPPATANAASPSPEP